MEIIALLLLGLVVGTVVGWVVRARMTPPPAPDEAAVEIRTDLAAAQATADELREASRPRGSSTASW